MIVDQVQSERLPANRPWARALIAPVWAMFSKIDMSGGHALHTRILLAQAYRTVCFTVNLNSVLPLGQNLDHPLSVFAPYINSEGQTSLGYPDFNALQAFFKQPHLTCSFQKPARREQEASPVSRR